MSDRTEVPCTIEVQVEKAICIIPEFIDGWENTEGLKVWIPLSQVDEIHPDRVVIASWIAEKKGLI